MRTSDRGLKLIEAFEGFSAKRYLDSVGVPTIGYGTTAADIGTVPPTCTREQAEGWLRGHLASKYEPAVNALGVPLNQNQFDALVSLVYNCGPGAMQWQIGKDLRVRNYKAASADFMRYVYAGGRPLQGLINRRAAERRLFDTPAPSVSPAAPTEPPVALYTHAVIRRKNGDLEVFVEDTGGMVWRRQMVSGKWQNWSSLGKPG